MCELVFGIGICPRDEQLSCKSLAISQLHVLGNVHFDAGS